ncbi:hypothetical protein THAOC_16523, partial [Thalassiosira oceanica]
PLLRRGRVRNIPRGGDQQQQNNASGGQGIVPGASAAAYSVPADPSDPTPPPPQDRVDSTPAGYDYIDAPQPPPGGYGQPGAFDEQRDLPLRCRVTRVRVVIFLRTHVEDSPSLRERGRRVRGRGRRPRQDAEEDRRLRPLVILFLGELVGAVMGLSGGKGGNGGRSTKRRLKGVLNLHKAVELMTMTYNVIRLAVWPSRYVPREVYIGRTVSNFFFLMQCQLYTSLSWDGVKENTEVIMAYEDYSAEEPQYYENNPHYQQPQQRYDNSSGWN